MVLTQTLVKVAIAGGFVSIGSAIFFKSRIKKNFTNQEFFVGSLQVLGGYKNGGDILGLPVCIKNINMEQKGKNWTDGLNAKVTIPVHGSNEKGVLTAWSSRPDLQQNWRVDKADLEVRGTQWTFFIHPEARNRYKPTHQSTPGIPSKPDISS